MTSHSKLYLSDSFSPEKVKNYTLLIQIGNTDFSFAVVYLDKLLACGKYYPLAELSAPDELGDYLNPGDYQKVIIGIIPRVFNIVPKEVYNADRATNFARFLNVQQLEKAYVQTLDNENLALFKDGNDILPVLTTRYTNNHLLFAYKGWLKAITATEPTWTNLYIDVQLDTVHFAYFKSNKLRFYNSFNYAGPAELIYFTALTANELQLSPVTTRLVVSGDVVENDQSISNLSEFFPKIDMSQLKPVQQLPNHIAPQNLVSLTALILCA